MTLESYLDKTIAHSLGLESLSSIFYNKIEPLMFCLG